MFLDEPTTGLDPRSRNQVWDIIRMLVAGGTTILLCTQYLEEADQLAEGIAVIDHGKVIAEGTPGQLKASVGSGSLHVRLLDPEQRARGRAGAGPRAGRRAPRARPGGARRAVRGRRPGRRGGRGAVARRHRHRGLLARSAEPGRGLPRAHRPYGRAPTPRSRRRRHEHARVPYRDRSRRGRRPQGDRLDRPATAAERDVGGADLRLARHAQGQARPRAAARRDDHAGHVRADVHVPVRRRDRRARPASTSTTSSPASSSCRWCSRPSTRAWRSTPTSRRASSTGSARCRSGGRRRSSARCSATACAT